MKRLTRNMVDKMGACDAAMRWIDAGIKHGKTANDLWQECTHPDWMLWLLWHMDIPRNLRIKICARIVRETPLDDGRTVQDLLTDERSRHALDMAERFIEGQVTENELDEAIESAYAAYAAAYAANAAANAANAAAYAAANAAANAAYAAYAAANAAANAAYAAAYAAANAAYAAYAAANAAARAAQCNIIRAIFPAWQDVLKATE